MDRFFSGGRVDYGRMGSELMRRGDPGLAAFVLYNLHRGKKEKGHAADPEDIRALPREKYRRGNYSRKSPISNSWKNWLTRSKS